MARPARAAALDERTHQYELGAEGVCENSVKEQWPNVKMDFEVLTQHGAPQSDGTWHSWGYFNVSTVSGAKFRHYYVCEGLKPPASPNGDQLWHSVLVRID